MIGCCSMNYQVLNDWMILSPIIACFTWHFLIPMHLGSGLGLGLGLGQGQGQYQGQGLLGFICDSSYHTPIKSTLPYTNQIHSTIHQSNPFYHTPIKTLLPYTNQISPNIFNQSKSVPSLQPIINHTFPLMLLFPIVFPASPIIHHYPWY